MIIHSDIHQQLAAARQAELRAEAERVRPMSRVPARRHGGGPRAFDRARRLVFALRVRPAAHGCR